MSASETNVSRQAKRHKGPVIGIVLAVVVGLALLFGVVFSATDDEAPAESPSVGAEVN